MKNVTYGIYVNTDRKYITIHYSSCGACKNGLGEHTTKDTTKSYWKKASTLPEAEDKAKKIANDYPNKKIQIKKCNLCFK